MSLWDYYRNNRDKINTTCKLCNNKVYKITSDFSNLSRYTREQHSEQFLKNKENYKGLYKIKEKKRLGKCIICKETITINKKNVNYDKKSFKKYT